MEIPKIWENTKKDGSNRIGKYQRNPKSFTGKVYQGYLPKAISAGHGTRIKQ
jgi:hypothetical protein